MEVLPPAPDRDESCSHVATVDILFFLVLAEHAATAAAAPSEGMKFRAVQIHSDRMSDMFVAPPGTSFRKGHADA